MLADPELDVARLFHLGSAHLRCRPPLPASASAAPSFRVSPGASRRQLPGRDFALAPALGHVLQTRRTSRDFATWPLPLETLGRLLHASYGQRGLRDQDGMWMSDRPCPSAGGKYPLEISFLARGVSDLADGLYHYDPRAHELEVVDLAISPLRLADAALDQTAIADANLVVLISAVFERTMGKYGQRGYRYVWLDAGHLGQNLCLIATALGLGAQPIGGFYDDEVNLLARLPDGEEVVYVMAIGACGAPEHDS